MKFISEFIDFMLPRMCFACGEKLSTSEFFICTPCSNTFKYADADRIQNEFHRKFSADKIISDFHSLFVFEKDKGLQELVHSIKYGDSFRLGQYLGRIAGIKLKDKIGSWTADLLVPVPLHHVKKADRGYNQSFYIAKGISSVCRIPVSQSIVKRNRYTPSQTQLNKSERIENMLGAFQVKKPQQVKDKSIIIIDDVITTGSTISECGKVFTNAGAKNVYALSLAIAD